MPIFQYRFEVGERQLFRQTVSILMQDPQAGELFGRLAYDIDYEVMAVSEYGGWDIKMARKLVERTGPLTESIPEEQLRDGQVVFRMTADGTPFDLGQGLPPRLPCFAYTEVRVGSSWNVPDAVSRDGLPPLTMTYQVTVMEKRDGDLQADLVGMSETEQREGDQVIKVSVAGTVTFAVTRGKIVGSITKIEMEWPSQTPETERPVRRRTQTAIQLERRT